ncbi:MAG: hypothetical protein MK100_04830 [Phycisphaerales bacterium]|nr:hypothetical protein [Phycisphaerales bacterium]
MKTIAVLASGLMVAPAFGAVYTDPVGDIATGNPNLDITQIEINDDGNDLVVRMTVDQLDADWGKYLFFMDALDGGSGDNDNPWGRDIGGLAGMDIFLGTWLDGGGGVQGYEYSASGWGGLSYAVSVWADWDNNTVEWNFVNLVADMSALGVTGFDFEAATTGGGAGDPAIDLIGAEGTQPGWGGGSTSTDLLHYDFSTIPAPGLLMMFGLAGLATRRRR